jgi:hypothetical protein
MKIRELVTPSLGKTSAATPPGTMGKVMNKFQSAGTAIKTAATNTNTAINKYMTAPIGKASTLSSKLGKTLAGLNKGAGVANYSQDVDKSALNDFVSVLIQTPSGKTDEPELVQSIKNILDNPADTASKGKVIDYIKNFRTQNAGTSHADFNTQFRSLLTKLDIKPDEFKLPRDNDAKPSAPTAAKPPVTSVDPAQGNLPLK